MSDRQTPETDDIARGNHVVPTEWAKQLERERDEARRNVTAIHSCHNECQRPICVLRRERDEARAALMKIEDLFIDGTDIYADRENMGMIAKTALEEIK